MQKNIFKIFHLISGVNFSPLGDGVEALSQVNDCWARLANFKFIYIMLKI